ncbi:MAG: dTDP-4-amino-4,6-dideoxyglucose formyltransferase [Bacteroidales bacterium]|nr:dTDP-4-amino-4,6-dideoxyglucose formyltransferase [Bacteroidales bacterium]
MKKVLVLTDNILQYERFKNLVSEKQIPDCEFIYSHSPVNSPLEVHQDFLNKISSIDVNLQTDFLISNFNLIISMHCFQFFPKALVNNVRCLNVHPGYNPINRGWYPQVFAIINDLPIGATIHEMDEKLDNGPIIARKFVKKDFTDTSDSLYEKILDAEIELLEEYFESIINNTYKTNIPEEQGKLYLKKDFNRLCELNLNETITFHDFYNKLRALSHSPYQNAYFINPETGKKVFISINIKESE